MPGIITRFLVSLRLLCLLLPFLPFCISQQAPFYNTPKFDPSANHRSNLCQRQQELFSGNITLREALAGMNISVVLTNYTSEGSMPFFTLNEQGVIDEENPGLFAIILDELAERAKFSWRDSYGVVLPVDSKTDGNMSWSDLLAWEVDTFDLSAGKWDRSIQRMSEEIAFPEGWFDSSMIVVNVVNESSEQLNIWSFLLPFQWSVWALLVVTVVISGLAYWFLERLDAHSDERRLEGHPGEPIFYTAITFTGHFEFRPQTSAAMILTFSTTFIALIICAVYTANLASFLVARRAPSHTIETVQQAVLMGAPICVQAKVNIDDYLSEKYEKAVLVRRPTKEEVLGSLKSGECSIAVVAVSEYEQLSSSSSVNGDCTLQWDGRVEQNVPAGFASDVDSGRLCTSLISHVLDLHFIEMRADGFLEREWEAFLQRTGDQNCVKDVDTSTESEDETFSLGIQEMAGIFIIHLILLALALIVAMIHYCRNRKLRSRSQRQLEMTSKSHLRTQESATAIVSLPDNSDHNPQIEEVHTSTTLEMTPKSQGTSLPSSSPDNLGPARVKQERESSTSDHFPSIAPSASRTLMGGEFHV